MFERISLSQVTRLLQQKGYQPQLKEDTQQIFSVLRIEGKELALLCKIIHKGQFLQLVAYFPFNTTPQAASEMARLLHYLNRELDLPGFGFEEKQSLVFYRLLLPCLNQRLDEELFFRYLSTVINACSSCFTLIHHIAKGSETFDGLMEKAQVASA